MKFLKSHHWSILGFLCALIFCQFTLYIFDLAGPNTKDPATGGATYIPYTNNINTGEGYGHRHINKYGFKDRNYDLNKDIGYKRAILLGNSMTEADQVDDEQTYDNILEDLLTADGKKIEIWNSGRSGMHLIEYLALYQRIELTIPHQYVILQLNQDDIFRPDMASCKAIIRNDSLITDYCPPNNTHRFTYTLRNNFSLFNAIAMRLFILKKFIASNSETTLNTATAPKVPSESKKKLKTLLALFTKEAKKNGAKVFLFPYPLPDTKEAEITLKTTCAETGVIYLDNAEIISKAAKKDKPIEGFLNTKLGFGHLNSYGHTVLANALYSKIRPYIK